MAVKRKKAGPAPKIQDKMRTAYRTMIAEDNKRIDAEPMQKTKCDCGCK